MSAAWFFVGVLAGMFITLGLAWLSIVIERRQNKKNEDYHRRFIQAQVDWILTHQPTDEEIRNMFSTLPASEGENHSKTSENCEVNEKVGEVCGDNRFETIDAAKKDLLESTNIDTSPKEMEVIDRFLFRCWQMGWLDKYEKGGEG